MSDETEKILLGVAVCFADLGPLLAFVKNCLSWTVSSPRAESSVYPCPCAHSVQFWASLEPWGQYSLAPFLHSS